MASSTELLHDNDFWRNTLPADMKKLSQTQKLHLVFSLLVYLHLSLNKFLVFIFTSSIRKVQERANIYLAFKPTQQTFHDQFLPSQIFDIWADTERFPNSEDAMSYMIEEVAYNRARKECRQLTRDPSLKVKLPSLTVEGIRNILHPSEIITLYQEHAPFVWNILIEFVMTPNEYRARKVRMQAKEMEEDTEAEEPVQDLDDDSDKNEPSTRKAAPESPEGFTRNPVLAVMVAISMLIFVNNCASNALQVVLGLFFKTHGTNSRVLSVLSSIGLSVSAFTIERIKKQISDNAIELAIELMLSESLWAIIFDNINIFLRKFSQRMTNQNSMIHATNVAIIKVSEEGIDKHAATDLQSKLDLRGERHKAVFNDILPSNEDVAHLESVFNILLAEIIVRYTPGSKAWKEQKEMLDRLKELMPRDRPLPPEKTDARPFGVFDVNEGSKKGIIEVLEAIQRRSTMTTEQFSEKIRTILGDWLTSNNLRGARRERADDINVMERVDYADELSQLFHFALQATHMIMRAHYGNAILDPTSLASHKGLLNRKWDVEKPNYAAAKSLIRHSLIARVLHIVMVKKNFSRYSQLESWEPQSFEELLNLAGEICQSHATATAARSAKAAKDDYAAHDAYFIRDALIFLAFEDGIAYADAGRVLRVLKFWCHAFRGVGQHNYARECAEILLKFKYETTDAQRSLLERSWFYNRWGTPGSFIPSDLYLEQLNFWVKCVYIASGNAVTVDYIIEKGSASVEAFRDISHLVANFFGDPDRRRHSKEVSFETDLRVLVEAMQAPTLALHKEFRERTVEPIKGSKKTGNSAIFDIIDHGLGTWGESFWDFISSTTIDPAVGFAIGNLSAANTTRDTRLDNDTPFDSLTENPLSIDQYDDIHSGDSDEGGIGGGGEFNTGDEVDM